MTNNYVVLLISPRDVAQVIGDEAGDCWLKPQAERLAARYRRAMPTFEVLVLPVQPLGIANVPISLPGGRHDSH